MKISFRPIQNNDETFLFKIYASTREEELAAVPWTSEQKHEFLRQQFKAQHDHYQKHFSDAQFMLILANDEPIGRLYRDDRENEIRLIDIALLPAFRGQGIGEKMLRDILAEGKRRDVLVRIHVEQNNPALRLYSRLGFQAIEEQGIYYLMEWAPQDKNAEVMF
ncbi:MAG: GNAT family N-acetyltransferase [Deferribacteres bacterium]|nr:GNAT family N-acetyltransferase [candidate division KSB1 bacterium]MCB9500667.1 GNAT family N-acetyltransferase [Deferribacteres bacterium]